MKQALQALIFEMEYVLSCINKDKIPFDGDDFHEALRLGKEALAKQEQELALQKLHDENERLGLYKDAYGEEHKESVRLQCVVCNTVYANGVPPQVAKQEQGEPKKKWKGQIDNDEFFESLEQEQGEPVAYLVTGPYEKQPFANIGAAASYCKGLNKGFGEDAYTVNSLYTTPQPAQKPWVGLTTKEMAEVANTLSRGNFLVGIQSIEAKLKEKNT